LTWEKLFRDWRVGVLATLAVGACVYNGIGRIGIIGYTLGVVSVGLNCYFMWLTVRLMNQVAKPDTTGQDGSALVVIAFLIKLPIVVGCMLWARKFGPYGQDGFLWGMALVYLAMTGWAQAARPK